MKALFGWILSLPLVVLACSGTDTTIAANDGGSVGDATNGDASSVDGASADGSDHDTGGGDGAAPDTGSTDAAKDGAVESDGGDSGLVSDPGTVNCGATTCPTPSQFCCVDYAAADGGTRTCASTANLSACMQGTRQACDEKADCQASQVCCIELGQGFGETTRCMPTCITGAVRYQACRTSAECENQQPCRLVTCPGNPPMGMCEVPPGCQ